MGFFSPRGVMCLIERPLNLDDGTLCRGASGLPGVSYYPGAISGSMPEPPTKAAVLERAASFIFEGEGGSPKHPYWPKGESGITWGVGWDAGQNKEEALNADWGSLPPKDLAVLKTAIGKKGPDAEELLDSLKKINIPSDVALKVFREKSMPRYYAIMLTAFPGVDRLPIEAQMALLSLIYNRGGWMGEEQKGIKDTRWEMRRVRDAVKAEDLPEIAEEVRNMKRLWKGTANEKGLGKRRDSEAKLIERAIIHEAPCVPEIGTAYRMTIG